METKLTNFLIDDVNALIETINNNMELAAMPAGNFNTLADFAAYWSAHINNINP